MLADASSIEEFNGIVERFQRNDTSSFDADLKKLIDLYRRGMETTIPILLYTIGRFYDSIDSPKAKFFFMQALDIPETSERAAEALSKYPHEIDAETEKILRLKPMISHTTFNDVVGLEHIKSYVQKNIIYPLANTDSFSKYHQKIGASFILYGPPGNGKTLLAKAIAGSVGVPFINIESATLKGQYQGVTAKNVKAVFEQARAISPCILFFDEFEHLAQKRENLSGDSRHGGTSDLLSAINTMLTELDGAASNETIFIVGSTNRPWMLDSAITRSGRFEDLLYVPPPDRKQRELGFQYYFKDKNTTKLHYRLLSTLSEGYSQADIAKIANKTTIEHIFKRKDKRISNTEILRSIADEKGSLLNWFNDARKELVGERQLQIVNGKKIEKWDKGKIEENDRQRFKPLLKDLLRFASADYAHTIAMRRNIAKVLSYF